MSQLLNIIKKLLASLFSGAKNLFVKNKIYSIITLVFVGLVVCIFLMSKRNTTLKNERDTYKNNTTALLKQTEQYKTKDSLNAASAYEVSMSLDTYKKYHEQDMKTIKQLQIKGRTIQSITSVDENTNIPVSIPVKDSIVYRDKIIKDTVKTIKSYTEWYYIDGIVDKSFEGKLGFNEKLHIVVSIEYKRFLGFLWHINKIKNSKVDVVSLNPYSKIIKVEYTTTNK